MNDPVVVTKSDGREELEQESLDFGGEERSGHIGEEGLEVVFDEIHNNEYSARRVSQVAAETSDS